MSASLIDQPRRRVRADPAALLVAAALTILVLVLFATAPRNEQFPWTDAATFALNGDLIRDYLANGLPGSPLGFARDYFLRYPALTISLYPPIFPAVEAALFAVFGFSHAAAQATVALFAALAAWGAYAMARSAMPRLAAAAVPLVLFACPGVLLWSRQVMMEIPSLAFLLLAAALLLRYQAAPSPTRLLLVAVMLLAAIYTKQTAVFALPVFGLALLLSDGLSVVRRPSLWVTAAVGFVGLIPLLLFTALYASQQFDVASGSGLSGEANGPSRLSLEGWLTCARALPEIAGWVPLLGGAGYVAFASVAGFRAPAERRLVVLMACWFVVAYAFVSLIGHFESRYGMPLALPPATLTVMLAARVLGKGSVGAAPFGAAAALFATAVILFPVKPAPSYALVADEILSQSGQDDVVLYNGENSKSLAFSLRARSPAAKIFLVRAEKPLLDYHFAIQQERGIHDANLSEAQVEAIIDRMGVSLIALQPGFWNDRPSIARLWSVARSSRFVPAGEIVVSDTVTVQLFRNVRPTPPTRASLAELVAGL